MTRFDAAQKLGVRLGTCCACDAPILVEDDHYGVFTGGMGRLYRAPACTMQCATSQLKQKADFVALIPSTCRPLAEHDGDGVQFYGDGFERWKAGT